MKNVNWFDEDDSQIADEEFEALSEGRNVSRSNAKKVKGQLARAMTHMIKFQAQKDNHQTKSWIETMIDARRQILDIKMNDPDDDWDNGNFQREIHSDQTLDQAYHDAVPKAKNQITDKKLHKNIIAKRQDNPDIDYFTFDSIIDKQKMKQFVEKHVHPGSEASENINLFDKPDEWES